jgi:hypothetical protein
MRTDLSLTALATELERRAGAKQDYVADTRKLAMTENASIELGHGQADAMTLLPNDVAHRQIATRLEIPGRYYDRMRSEAPELLARNVNNWLHTQPETRLLRVLDGQMRAFLSDRYQRIENEEIARIVLPILLEQQGVQIVSSSITETRMYIKAVFTKVQGEVAKGDVVQAGVTISNSEVGLGAVKIEPLVYRLVCLNGMTIPDAKYTARHVGGRILETENVRDMLTDETLKADDKAILLKVRDVVKASFNEVRFARQIDTMREATGQRIEGNPVEAVKLLAKRQQLNEFEETSILRNLIEGADLSRWGLVNAVTATAKADELTYDRATEFEALGGVLLTMPANDWTPIAKAA